ncbi:MAG: hypothetical protein Q9219_005508 [cf. Caloplaca sp. 3 TL-2023]
MGTLTDITSKAVNKNMRVGESPMLTPKGTPSKMEDNAKTNFMTPTMASAKKAYTASTKENARSLTPTSTSAEKAVSSKWMNAAVRRVGLRRVTNDRNPRSKQEGPNQSNSTVVFPDKLSASSRNQMPDSSRPARSLAPSPSDKPLPSPPVAQIKTDYIEEPRSLIDASERPLRRVSPNSSENEEEWPILFPQKPTKPDAIHNMLQQPSPELARNATDEQERYPLLRRPEAVTPNIKQKPTSNVPLAHKAHHREGPSSLRGKNDRSSPAERQGNDGAIETANPAPAQSRARRLDPKATHRLSAGAAAVEKSSFDTKLIKEPRQTRTSSLRARISAGQVIKESPNKVLGFTDFTVDKGPLPRVGNDTLEAGIGFRTRSSSSFSKAFAKRPSRDSLNGTRAPAQFVAGSRRPVPRRPSSRNSLRSDSKASSPAFFEPSRPAPPAPTAKSDNTTRRSSIPIARNSASTTTSKVNPGNSSNGTSATIVDTEVDNGLYIDVGISQPKLLNEEPTPQASAVACSDVNRGLTSIEESPKSTFRSKRLSDSPSTLGPTLKISSSANRIIMGTGGSDKGNQSIVKKRSRDLFRAAVTNEYRASAKGKNTNVSRNHTSGRPLSSQGFSEDRSHRDSPLKTHKVKKVKSADLSSVPFNTQQKSEVRTLDLRGNSECNGTSEHQNYFPDAIGEDSTRSVQDTEPTAVEAYVNSSSGPFISPVKDSATPVSDAIPVVTAFLPIALQAHVNKENGLSETANLDKDNARNTAHPTLQVQTDFQEVTNLVVPSTPQAQKQNDGSPSSSNFPPRCSSRMQQPNYTTNGSAKSSSVPPTDEIKSEVHQRSLVTRPTEVAAAEGKSIRPDLESSPGFLSSQTILTDVERKRDSAARESSKSQGSISKGLISNFRGLFHKRTSDSSESSIVRPAKKGHKRPIVTAHGSPFQSMSHIHPLYRPTQASINRTAVHSQKPMLHGTGSVSPGTPAIASPIPSEVSTTTNLAMQIIESARRESSSPKKERLLEMSQLLVNTITQAHDAEKAMEEARHAARKAEVAHALCKKSVSDVANMVKEWKGEFNRLS